MLPPELIRSRKRKGTIRLLYATEDKLSLAKTLVSIYKDHVERTRGELKEALSGCEELGFNYKLVRGLSAVLEERCVFRSGAVVDPIEARRAVFEEAADRVISTEEERRRVISAAAFLMHISANDLDRSLYADLADDQLLVDFESVPPLDLLKEYNFALTLVLLAHASRLELNYKGRSNELEELGNKIGRCNVLKDSSTSKMVVEWRPTKRIGYKASHLEDLLANLVLKKEWSLSAGVKYPLKSKRTYKFEINEIPEGKLIRPTVRKQELHAREVSKHEFLTRPKDEIIDVSEMALRLGVTDAEVRMRFKLEDEGYLDLGGIFITKEKLDDIKKALAGAPDMRLKTIQAILRRLGCRSPLPLLEVLCYHVEWAKKRDQSVVYRL